MKKFTLIVLILFVFAGTMLFSESLEQVLAKNYETRGGLDKLRATKTMKASGKMVMEMQNMEMPMTMWFKKPNKLKMQTELMGQKMIMGFDGQKAWMIMPMMGTIDPQEMPAEQSKEIIQQAESMDPLVDYKKRGDQLELIGKEDMEGTEIYKLKMTKKSGREIFFYLDTETGIEIKTIAFIKVQGKEMGVETFFGDYKEVSGIMMPFSISTKTAGMGTKMLIDSYVINEKIEDSFFAMPPKTEKKEVPKK